jgi:hypothetical protein
MTSVDADARGGCGRRIQHAADGRRDGLIIRLPRRHHQTCTCCGLPGRDPCRQCAAWLDVYRGLEIMRIALARCP